MGQSHKSDVSHDNNYDSDNERISRIPFHVNVLSYTEQVQIQKYKIHAYRTPKTAGV